MFKSKKFFVSFTVSSSISLGRPRRIKVDEGGSFHRSRDHDGDRDRDRDLDHECDHDFERDRDRDHGRRES